MERFYPEGDMERSENGPYVLYSAAQEAVEAVERERDLAVAHDRQPYPTAEAYEKACAALHAQRARADRAEAHIKAIKEEMERRANVPAREDALELRSGVFLEAAQLLDQDQGPECETCGGSGEVIDQPKGKAAQVIRWKPCPDCTGDE